MGATEEQMQLLSDGGVTHVSYVLILYSFAFLLFLCKSCGNSSTLWKLLADPRLVVCMLLHLYSSNAEPTSIKLDPEGLRTNGAMNGNANGHARPRMDRRVRDAEEFELEGLISDDEGADALKDPGTPRAPNTSRQAL
jgi:hypothetical protein